MESAETLSVVAPPMLPTHPELCADTPPPAAEAPPKEELTFRGYTKKMAMELIAAGKPAKFLTIPVVSRVYMVHQANSLPQLQRMQRLALKMAKDEKIDARTRAAAMAIVPQCVMAIARLSECAIRTAHSANDVKPESDGAPPPQVQNNFFGFPPVAEPEDAARGRDIIDVSESRKT